MTNITKTIKELNDIINYLKTKVDSTTTYANPAEKTAWEKRLNDLKTNDSTHELSLIGLAEFETNLAKDIARHIQEKTELVAQKRLVETERDNKDSLLTTKEAELTQKEAELQVKITEIIGLTEAKLTKEVIDKIDALSTDPNNLSAVKSSLEEMKKTLEATKDASTKLPAWAVYYFFGVSIGSFLLIIYQVFFPKKKARKEIEFEEE